jgi:hypothetical protein
MSVIVSHASGAIIHVFFSTCLYNVSIIPVSCRYQSMKNLDRVYLQGVSKKPDLGDFFMFFRPENFLTLLGLLCGESIARHLISQFFVLMEFLGIENNTKYEGIFNFDPWIRI